MVVCCSSSADFRLFCLLVIPLGLANNILSEVVLRFLFFFLLFLLHFGFMFGWLYGSLVSRLNLTFLHEPLFVDVFAFVFRIPLVVRTLYELFMVIIRCRACWPCCQNVDSPLW